jgi:hypothetical protein
VRTFFAKSEQAIEKEGFAENRSQSNMAKSAQPVESNRLDWEAAGLDG